MDLVRSLVSQKKIRYQLNSFDLDLTYITDRVIAMGFPSEKIEGMFRNPMSEVQRFLELFHGGHYRVYNLCSERGYDPQKFKGQAHCFPMDDHNCPSIETMEGFCMSASEWLEAHPLNVIAVHCKAGKGRTGLMISALLLHLGLLERAEESLEFFGVTRCEDNKGVTIPSQKRFVQYFEQIQKFGPVPLITLGMSKVILKPPPKVGRLKILLRVIELGADNEKREVIEDALLEPVKDEIDDGEILCFTIPPTIRVRGAVKFEFWTKGDVFGKPEQLCRFWLHTSFLGVGTFHLSKDDIDAACKDSKCKRFEANFTAIVHFTTVQQPTTDAEEPIGLKIHTVSKTRAKAKTGGAGCTIKQAMEESSIRNYRHRIVYAVSLLVAQLSDMAEDVCELECEIFSSSSSSSSLSSSSSFVATTTSSNKQNKHLNSYHCLLTALQDKFFMLLPSPASDEFQAPSFLSSLFHHPQHPASSSLQQDSQDSTNERKAAVVPFVRTNYKPSHNGARVRSGRFEAIPRTQPVTLPTEGQRGFFPSPSSSPPSQTSSMKPPILISASDLKKQKKRLQSSARPSSMLATSSATLRKPGLYASYPSSSSPSAPSSSSSSSSCVIRRPSPPPVPPRNKQASVLTTSDSSLPPIPVRLSSKPHQQPQTPSLSSSAPPSPMVERSNSSSNINKNTEDEKTKFKQTITMLADFIRKLLLVRWLSERASVEDHVRQVSALLDELSEFLNFCEQRRKDGKSLQSEDLECFKPKGGAYSDGIYTNAQASQVLHSLQKLLQTQSRFALLLFVLHLLFFILLPLL
ncbi:Phosphatidylinositol-3,4, 5-trisphosphate3-phosphatase, putative, variant 4 [Balamuthia mandrillaris]